MQHQSVLVHHLAQLLLLWLEVFISARIAAPRNERSLVLSVLLFRNKLHYFMQSSLLLLLAKTPLSLYVLDLLVEICVVLFFAFK